MLKHELRAEYKKKRHKLTTDEVFSNSLLIANNTLKLPIWDFFYFHIFLSISENKEVDTNPLITLFQGKDRHVVIPKMNGDNTLDNYLLTDSTLLKKNAWNIPEPVDGIEIPETKIDVVFIPLLAFDVLGNRVGYGKGFYDRFLEKCRADVVKVGVSFFEHGQEIIDDIDDNDIPLNYCVTPKKIYEF